MKYEPYVNGTILKVTSKTTFIYQLFSLITLFGFGTFFGTIIAENNNVMSLKTIKITSDNWCPYICPDTLRNKGLIIDVVTAALKEVGLKTEYIYTKSWNRSIQNVTSGKNDILLDAFPEHNKILDISDSYYVLDESVFVILKNSNITLNYPKDLWNYRLGVIEGYVYDNNDDQWEKHITGHPNPLKSAEPLGEPHLLELLTRKRIDIALVNWDVARYKLNETDIKKFNTIEKGISSYLRIGFTRSERGRKIKDKFEQGFNRLIGTDKLKNIYAKYYIKMPDFSVTD
jgi:ABC-type amino acid transport substrate-binding protein